ncbi:hypothetical protein D3C87_1097050 [compost metagenome]
MRESVCWQRLQDAAGCELVQPAIKQLHHVRPLAGHVGGNHAGLVVGVRKGHLLDGDVRIGLLKLRDQLVHGFHACVEDILPIFDFNRLRGVECKCAETGNQAGEQSCPAHVSLHFLRPVFRMQSDRSLYPRFRARSSICRQRSFLFRPKQA